MTEGPEVRRDFVRRVKGGARYPRPVKAPKGPSNYQMTANLMKEIGDKDIGDLYVFGGGR